MANQTPLAEEPEHLKALGYPDKVLVESDETAIAIGTSTAPDKEPVDPKYRGHWSHGH